MNHDPSSGAGDDRAAPAPGRAAAPPTARPTLASPPPTARGIGDDATVRMLLPVGRSGLSITAGYLGLLSVLCIFAPFALIVGILAVMDLRRNPHKRGMGRAVFGIVMGGIFTVFGVVVVVNDLLQAGNW